MRKAEMKIKSLTVALVVIAALVAAMQAIGSSKKNSPAATLTSITVVQILDKNVPPQLPVGALRQFTAYANYSDGTQTYVTQQAAWSSADNTIATVTPSMGLVTAEGVGTVNITATYQGVQGSSSLTTLAATLTQVGVTPASWTMQTGTSQQFNAIAEYGGATMTNVTSIATWKSSNTKVATVSSTGLVQAVGAGTASISASYTTRGGSTTLTVTTTPPPNLGMWSPPESLGMLGIHAAVLNTGKVLFIGYPIGRSGGPAPARLYDPIADTVTDVTLPFPVDIFCGGDSILADGLFFMAGGLDDGQYPADAGITNSTMFNPANNTWTQGPNMSLARWYPGTVPMPDGTIFTLAGTDSQGLNIERPTESYNHNTNAWTLLPPSAKMPPNPDDYPQMILLPSGNVFYAAPRQDSQMYNPTTQSWSFVANMNYGERYRSGSLLLPHSQQVMIASGESVPSGGGSNPTNTTEIIDFSQSTPVWTYGPPMNIARYNHNLIYLADGTILAVGGNQNSNYTSPVFQPELYNPVTGTWTLLPPQIGLRGYHSTAVLLPDGRVISAASDSGKSLENTYEIYSPPYLFNGPRPTITSVPSQINYNLPFTIVTPDAANVTRVALLRPAATTHADHMDDKYYIDLTWTVGSGQITATAPAKSNYAAPGYYMLVILNQEGVPSVMPFVQLLPKRQ